MAELEPIVQRLVADVDELKRGYQEAEQAAETVTNRIGQKFQALGQRLASAGKALSLGITAPLLAAAGVAAKAADIQIGAEARLSAAIKASGTGRADEMETLKEYASVLQQLTTVGDEATLQNLQVARSMGLTGKQAASAAKNAISLSRAFKISEKSAIRYTALLERGDTTMLQRYLPTLRSIEDQTEKVAEAQRLLGDGFKLAMKEATVGLGPLKQLSNSIGDLFEKFGELIFERINPFVLRMLVAVDRMNEMSRSSKEFALKIAAAAAAVGPALVAVGGLVAAVGTAIITLGGMGAAALTASAMVVSAMGTIAGPVVGLITLLGPSGLVAAAASVGIVWALTTSDMTKATNDVSTAWGDFEEKVKNFDEWLTGGSLNRAFEDVADFWVSTVETIQEVIANPMSAKDILDKFLSTVREQRALREAGREAGEEFSEGFSEADFEGIDEPGFEAPVRAMKSVSQYLADMGVQLDDLSPKVKGLLDSFELPDINVGDFTAGFERVMAKLQEYLPSVPEELKEALNVLFEDSEKNAADLEKKLRELFDRLGDGPRDFANKSAEKMKAAGDAIKGSLVDGFEKALVAGEKVEDVIGSIGDQILSMFIKQAVAAPIVGALTGMFGGNLFPATSSAQGNAFSGGQLLAFASGGIVNSPTVFPMANGAGIMGEAGRAEGVLPLSRMPNGDLGVQARGGGGGGRVEVNVYAPEGSSVDTNQRQQGDMTQLDVFIDRATAQNVARRGSLTNRALRTSFGATSTVKQRG